MQVTENQWKKIRHRLLNSVMSVKLMIDGYLISLKLVHITSRDYMVSVYVNGKIPFNCMKVGNEIGRRFLPFKETYRYSRNERLEFVKRYGMEGATRMGVAEKIQYHELDWRSLEAMQMHFVANNESIELYTII